MRNFSEADKAKKSERIRLNENPVNLSDKKITELETAVKTSLKDGYLSCPVAWNIAKKTGVPRIAVGAVTDKLGLRITDCQLGCFKVDKTPYDDTVPKEAEGKIAARLDDLVDGNKITCAAAHTLARELKVAPMAIAGAMNIKGMKIRDCQLGCF